MGKSKCSQKSLYKYFEDIGISLSKKKTQKKKKSSSKKKKVKGKGTKRLKRIKRSKKTKSRTLNMPARYSYYM